MKHPPYEDAPDSLVKFVEDRAVEERDANELYLTIMDVEDDATLMLIYYVHYDGLYYPAPRNHPVWN